MAGQPKERMAKRRRTMPEYVKGAKAAVKMSVMKVKLALRLSPICCTGWTAPALHSIFDACGN